jgi:hypothetical protein
MHLIYIISLGHSGSTLLDCLLGTHPNFISSGELRYLNWQLERTKSEIISVERQNVCTCLKDFRSCEFWSKVFSVINSKVGIDFSANPSLFELSFFNQFGYGNSGSVSRNLFDKFKSFLFRQWLQRGYSTHHIKFLEPHLEKWISNNWILYESMSEVSDRKFVIDSSKHLTYAMLLQESRPKDVTIIFIHRKIEGLVSSKKKWSKVKGIGYSIDSIVKSKLEFNNRIKAFKSSRSDLSFIDVDYEYFVECPSDFLKNFVYMVGASKEYEAQSNSCFYIDPSVQHLVAGNPMRYKGKQLIKSDNSWKDRLDQNEIEKIKDIF